MVNKNCEICKGRGSVGSEYERLDVKTGMMVLYRQPCPLCNSGGDDIKFIKPLVKKKGKNN